MFLRRASRRLSVAAFALVLSTGAGTTSSIPNLYAQQVDTGVAVSGRLETDDGSAIAGATLWLQGPDTGFPPEPPGSVFAGLLGKRPPEAYTESDGSFRFADVAPGTYGFRWRTRAGEDAFAYETASVDATDSRGLVVRSPRVHTVTGVVNHLRPVEGFDLRVHATLIHRPLPGIDLIVDRYATVSNEGVFELSGLVAGTWTVRARTQSGRAASVPLDLSRGEPVEDLAISLPTGFTVRGRADLPPGPPREAWVRLLHADRRIERNARFNSDEPFEIHDLPAGRYAVAISGTGFTPPQFSFATIDGDTEINMRVRGGTISGTLKDLDDGLPIADAHIWANPVSPSFTDSHQDSHRTDWKGDFEMGPWISGDWYLEITAPGYASRSPVITLGGTDISDIEILMQPTDGMTIEVAAERGLEPYRTHGAWFDLESGEMIRIREFEGSRESLTLRWPGAPRGRGILTVTRAWPRLGARIEIDHNGEPVVLNLERTVELHVAVADIERRPPYRSALELYDQDGHPVIGGMWRGNRYYYSVHHRAFRVPDLLPGSYTFRITTTDGRRWQSSTNVRAGSTNVVTITGPPLDETAR